MGERKRAKGREGEGQGARGKDRVGGETRKERRRRRMEVGKKREVLPRAGGGPLGIDREKDVGTGVMETLLVSWLLPFFLGIECV